MTRSGSSCAGSTKKTRWQREICQMIALLGIAVAITGLFAAVDRYVATDAKKDLYEFLRSRPNVFKNLPSAAAFIFTRIFGESHFSLRCIASSVIASLIFLALMYGLRIYLLIISHPSISADEAFYFVVHEIRYPFSSEARASFAISLALNLILDYVGLLKTRLIVAFLARIRQPVDVGVNCHWLKVRLARGGGHHVLFPFSACISRERAKNHSQNIGFLYLGSDYYFGS
jgi:hypothetical protein